MRDRNDFSKMADYLVVSARRVRVDRDECKYLKLRSDDIVGRSIVAVCGHTKDDLSKMIKYAGGFGGSCISAGFYEDAIDVLGDIREEEKLFIFTYEIAALEFVRYCQTSFHRPCIVVSPRPRFSKYTEELLKGLSYHSVVGTHATGISIECIEDDHLREIQASLR